MTGQNGWSDQKQVWEELKSLGADLSWTKVPFDPHVSHHVPAHRSGVYLVCARPPAEPLAALNAYTVLYAGQVKQSAHGLRARFQEHLKRPAVALRGFKECYYPDVHFWFAPVDGRRLIDDLEGLLIAAFNPPCNKVGAPGSRTLLARIGAGAPLRATAVA